MSDSTHTHHHSHSAEHPGHEELLALLSYMVAHNHHHAEELAQLAAQTDGAAAEALQKAILSFEEGNKQLETALQLMQNS